MIEERGDECNKALGWLMGEGDYGDDWVFSAESVCDALDIRSGGVACPASASRCNRYADSSLSLINQPADFAEYEPSPNAEVAGCI